MVQARIGAEGTVGMMVRMPFALRDRIKAAADKNGRSQNSEILATLEEKYPATAVRYIELDAMLDHLHAARTDAEKKSILMAFQSFLRSSGDEVVVSTDQEGNVLIRRDLDVSRIVSED